MTPQYTYKIPFDVANAYLDRPELQDIVDPSMAKAQAVVLAVSDLYGRALPRKQSRRGRMRAATTAEHFEGLRQTDNFDVYPIIVPNESLNVEECWTIEAADELAAIRNFRRQTEKRPIIKFEVETIAPTEYTVVTRGLDSVNKTAFTVTCGSNSWDEDADVSLFNTRDEAITFAEALALTTDKMVHVSETIVGAAGYENDIRIYREIFKKGIFKFTCQVPGNVKQYAVDSYMVTFPHKDKE